MIGENKDVSEATLEQVIKLCKLQIAIRDELEISSAKVSPALEARCGLAAEILDLLTRAQ